jgi:hypothetical protein
VPAIAGAGFGPSRQEGRGIRGGGGVNQGRGGSAEGFQRGDDFLFPFLSVSVS